MPQIPLDHADGILCHQSPVRIRRGHDLSGLAQQRMRPIVSSVLVTPLLLAMHEENLHPGIRETLVLLSQRYWWPSMRARGYA